MDPFIAVQKSSTSFEFKSSVDSLPRSQKYYTGKILDLIITKKDLIVDAATADSGVKFLFSFSKSESLRHLLRTKEVQDLIINNIAPHVTAIEEFGGLICGIGQDQQSTVLFSNMESFSAILKCFHRSKTSDDARWIATSVYNILLYNPSSKKLFNSLPVVEAFSFIIPFANDDDAVRWISNALLVFLNDNEEAQKQCASSNFFRIFLGMEKYAASSVSKLSFRNVLGKLDPFLSPLVKAVALPRRYPGCTAFVLCIAIYFLGPELWKRFKEFLKRKHHEFLEIFSSLRNHEAPKTSVPNDSTKLLQSDFLKLLADATTSSQLKSAVDSLPRNEKYFSAEIRDLLLSKKVLIVDTETANSVVKFLDSFSRVESLRPLLQTKEIYDLIINNIALHVTIFFEFKYLICNIVEDLEFAELFANFESFSAILKCFHRSKTSNDARWIAAPISDILLYNPSANKILNSLPVVEAFSFIIPFANDDDAVRWISEALNEVLKNNEEAQKNFGTAEFLKIFQQMEKHATTDESKESLQHVVNLLKSVVDTGRNVLQQPLADAASPQQLTSTLEIIKRNEHSSVSIDFLLQKQHLIQDEVTAIAVANFIKWFGENDVKSIEKKEIFEMIENVLIPKFNNNNNNTDPIFDVLAILFTEESARSYFSKISFRDFVSSSLSSASGNSLLAALDLLLSNNNTAKEVFGTPEFKKQFISQFEENSSTEYNSITKILDEAISKIQSETLKEEIVKENNSVIDEELPKKASEQQQVESRDVKQIFHQDPPSTVLNELERLEKEFVSDSSKTIVDLARDVDLTNKKREREGEDLQPRVVVAQPVHYISVVLLIVLAILYFRFFQHGDMKQRAIAASKLIPRSVKFALSIALGIVSYFLLHSAVRVLFSILGGIANAF
jgi:hypothetical protein